MPEAADGLVPGAEDAWLARYRDLRLDQVMRLARLEQRAVRVVGPGQAITADWLANRLTVRVDADGRIVSLRAG